MPGTPEQNGIVEWRNRTFMDMVLVSVKESHIG